MGSNFGTMTTGQIGPTGTNDQTTSTIGFFSGVSQPTTTNNPLGQTTGTTNVQQTTTQPITTGFNFGYQIGKQLDPWSATEDELIQAKRNKRIQNFNNCFGQKNGDSYNTCLNKTDKQDGKFVSKYGWDGKTKLPLAVNEMSEKKDLPYQEIQNIHNKSYIQYSNYIRLYNNALIDYDYNFENPKFAKKLYSIFQQLSCNYLKQYKSLKSDYNCYVRNPNIGEFVDNLEEEEVWPEGMLIIWSAEFIFKDGLPFYKYVNRVLLNNEKTLLDIMPLIKVLNYVLSNEIIYDRTWPDEQVTVYRMLDLDTKTVNQMANKLCEKTGKIIRSTTYAACSLDKTQAQKFAKGKDSVLLIIQVPPLELAPHFKSLKEHSIYKDEMEVLFTCYSAFKVEKVVREVGKCEVILTAVDNVNRHENKDDDWLCSF